MMDFDQVTYEAGYHSIKQLMDRHLSFKGNWDTAKKYIEKMAYRGEILIDFGDYRYIRYKKFFIPCIRVSPNKYRVLTFMLEYMVTTKKTGWQGRIDRYHSPANAK
jgi:hypothetical protein